MSFPVNDLPSFSTLRGSPRKRQHHLPSAPTIRQGHESLEGLSHEPRASGGWWPRITFHGGYDVYIYIYVWQWQEHILNIVWFSSGFGFGFGPYLYYWIEPHSWKLHHWFFLTWQLKNSWRPGEIQRKMGPTKFSGTNIAMEITVSLGNDLQMVDVHGLSISIVSLLRGTRRKFDPRVEMKPTEDSNDHFRSENLQPGPHLAACSPHMQGYSQEHLVLSCSICQKWYLGTCGSFQSICFVPSPIIW